MSISPDLTKIGIRPGVAILGLLRHLNYRPWFALAEFVDNALQSFLDYRGDLEKLEGTGVKLSVSIELSTADSGKISIRDNAAGIHEKDYIRAFRPAEIPYDRSGLSEFGMGMKSAACWFARNWTVRTSALGESFERTVRFNIADIVEDSIEELSVKSEKARPETHFTEIVLDGLHQKPHTRTIQKMRDHLASIFRVFVREGLLHLTFDGDPLEYSEPRVLTAPLYTNLEGPAISWRKPIEFDLGKGMSVSGFAAIREKASTSAAGFSLFRRRRLIQGSADEGYRPETIFGKSNSYRYQRVFGELHLEGFEISHTKDGFRWDENEEPFLELLKRHINDDSMPLLDQAEEHRVRPKMEDLKPAADKANARTAEVIEREAPPVLQRELTASPEGTPVPPQLGPANPVASERRIELEIAGQQWIVMLELTTDPSVGDWLTIGDSREDVAPRHGVPREIKVRVSLVHPFMERFAGTDAERIEPLLRVAAAIALAETAARQSGVRQAGTIRRNINELLRDALSSP